MIQMSILRRNKRKMTAITFKNLDLIYSTSKRICDEWGEKLIPLETLKVILDKSKIKKSEDSKVNEYIDKYNIVVENIYKDLSAKAKAMQSARVPLKQIKEAIDIVKQSFKEGLSE